MTKEKKKKDKIFKKKYILSLYAHMRKREGGGYLIKIYHG